MIIGVTGDTHNNLKNISKICSLFNERNPSLVIHTGDITLPKSLNAFSELNMPLVGVFGNNDAYEKNALVEESKKFECELFEEPHIIKVFETKILVVHHPEIIDEEATKNMDFILHGHTHRYKLEIKNKSIIFNPGECAGFMKGKNNIGLIDLVSKKTEIISF